MHKTNIWRGVAPFLTVLGAAVFTTSQALASGAGVVQYQLTDLGTIGGTESHAWGINDSGQIAGDSTTATANAVHAFTYSSGTGMVDLGVLPGDNISQAFGINASGQIAGFSGPAETSGIVHAFRYEPSTSSLTDLGVLDPTYNASYGFALNTAGDVVGFSFDSNGTDVPFLYTSGMGQYGGEGYYANAINDSNLVVGSVPYILGENQYNTAVYYQNGDPFYIVGTGVSGHPNSYAMAVNNASPATIVGLLDYSQSGYGYYNDSLAFTYTIGNSTYTTFAAPIGTTVTKAFGVNNSGVAVGTAQDGTYGNFLDIVFDQFDDYFYYQFGALYENGTSYTLNDLLNSTGDGWNVQCATAINNGGSIVGFGTNSSGDQHAILLTPTGVAATAPAAPTNLSGTLQPATAQVQLDWQDNSNGHSLTSVMRSTDGVNYSQIGQAGYGKSTYSDYYPVSNGKVYYYVQAVNSVGSSSSSNTVSVTTPKPNLKSVSPTTAYVNHGAWFTVKGTGFGQDCTVALNGSAVETEWESSTELRAYIDASAPGSDLVTVAYTNGTTTSKTLNVVQTELKFTVVSDSRATGTGVISFVCSIANTGWAPAATGVEITSATLNSVATTTTLPKSLGTLQPPSHGGGDIVIDAATKAKFTLLWPGSAGASGSSAKLVVKGSYSNGAFDFSTTVTLP